MSRIIEPNNGLIYMKVGTHAQEPLEAIVARKTREIEEAGYALWGYGGGTCHPTTMVQPFARDFYRRGGKIYLCMQPMISKHFADPIRASHYSVDGIKWESVPQAIRCVGSRYALVITDLHPEEFELELDRTRVAIGHSVGRAGSSYIGGRVDKACLEIVGADGITSQAETRATVHIGLVATVADPFAVFVRSDDSGT